MSWQSDKEASDRFIPQIKTIIARRFVRCDIAAKNRI